MTKAIKTFNNVLLLFDFQYRQKISLIQFETCNQGPHIEMNAKQIKAEDLIGNAKQRVQWGCGGLSEHAIKGKTNLSAVQ